MISVRVLANDVVMVWSRVPWQAFEAATDDVRCATACLLERGYAASAYRKSERATDASRPIDITSQEVGVAHAHKRHQRPRIA